MIILMLLIANIALANRESGGREDGRPPVPSKALQMPSLNCHLRQLSREAFVLRTSTSTKKTGRANVDVYGSGPTDALVKVGQHTGAWRAEAGNSVVLSDGNFVLRVFAFEKNTAKKFLATFESDSRGLTLLNCSAR